MPSQPRSWINKSGLSALRDLQRAYSKMGNPDVIEAAAMRAGAVMGASMQTIIRSQPDLTGYHDVSEGVTAFREDGGVHVGLPADHQLLSKAHQMEQQMSVADTVLDIERQTGETRRALYDALAELSGL